MLPPRRTALVVLAALAPLAAPAGAAASSASTSGGLSITGTAGVDTISVIAQGDKFRISDPSGMTASPGCALGVNLADCAIAEPGTVIVGLQGSADTFYAGSILETPFYVIGGDGTDQMWGGGGDDLFSGASGNDTAHGGGGDDAYADTAQVLFGVDPGSGNDTFEGDAGNDLFLAGKDATTDGMGKGADTFKGGPGIDTADYSERTAPLTITVGAAGGDGAAAENDTIADAERILGGTAADAITAGSAPSTVVGGPGGDTLRGGAAADRLFGGTEDDATGSGDDTLDGAGGPDVLRGGDGQDTASYAKRIAPVTVTLDDAANDGEAGEQDNVRTDVENVVGGFVADTLVGSSARNVLDGGPGPDTIDGGDAADTLLGGEGDDTILARDGQADTVACGPGTDAVVADAADVVGADCEQVDRPAAAPPAASPAPQVIVVPGDAQPGGQSAPLAGAALAVQITGGTRRIDRRGRLKVALRCPAQASPCAGSLALRRTKPTRTLATKRYRVPAGTTRTVTFTLPKGLRARVRHGTRLKLTLLATATGETANAKVTARK